MSLIKERLIEGLLDDHKYMDKKGIIELCISDLKSDIAYCYERIHEKAKEEWSPQRSDSINEILEDIDWLENELVEAIGEQEKFLEGEE